jgi:hypothetical protein
MKSSWKTRTLIICADYGWTGWVPSPDNFCFDVLPTLGAAGITVPNEVVNGRLCIYPWLTRLLMNGIS